MPTANAHVTVRVRGLPARASVQIVVDPPPPGMADLSSIYLLGGYAAGRLARFEGVKNGIGVVPWAIMIGIILGILGAILGNKFDVGKQLHPLSRSSGSLNKVWRVSEEARAAHAVAHCVH